MGKKTRRTEGHPRLWVIARATSGEGPFHEKCSKKSKANGGRTQESLRLLALVAKGKNPEKEIKGWDKYIIRPLAHSSFGGGRL